MRRPKFGIATLTLLAFALVLGACSTDSPTEPKREATAPNPGSGSPSGVWNLTLVASPNTISIDGTNDTTTTISLLARNAGNNQPPPNGATAVLSTSLGGFAAADGSTSSSTVINLTGGQGGAVLTLPGTATTTAIVQAQLEQSIAQTAVDLEIPPEPEPEPPPPPFFIDSLSPNAGSSDGSRVRINGSGFDPPVRVLFGDRPAQIVSLSANVLTVDTPPVELDINQTLLVGVSVTINLNDTDPEDTTQTDTLQNSFTYFSNSIPVPEILSITPRSGPNEGGTRVTIRGEGFSNQVQVFFGRPTTLVEAQITSISSTRLEVITPSATGVNSSNRNSIVNVEVINLDSGFSSTLESAFQYGNSNGSNIEISAIDPNIGPLEGGNQVRIFGQGFDDPISVALAGVLADIRSVSGTEIVVLAGVPPRSNGCLSIEGETIVTNIETNESASGPVYTYEAIRPQILSLSPTVSPAGGGGNLRIRGLDLPDTEVLVLVNNVEATLAGPPTSREINITIPPYTGAFPTEACDDNGDGTEGERDLPVDVSVRVLDLTNGCDATVTGFSYLPVSSICRNDVGPPVASFVVSGISGLTVNVDNTSTGSITTTNWNFGDGAISSASEPGSHSYLAPGTYTITLTVANAVGSSSTSEEVTVN